MTKIPAENRGTAVSGPSFRNTGILPLILLIGYLGTKLVAERQSFLFEISDFYMNSTHPFTLVSDNYL